jgi:hypothetical protein
MSQLSRKKRLESKLDIRQRQAALLIVERELSENSDERRTLEELAEEIGVTRKTLYQWRTQNKTFIDYVNIVADEFLESKRAVVYRQMMRLIEGSQPSVKALDLYMRRHGLLTDKTVVESSDGNNTRTNDDIEREIDELDDLLTDDNE